MPRYSELRDVSWLTHMYEVQQKSLDEIATALGCTPATVIRAMNKLKIARRRPSETRRLRGSRSGPKSGFAELESSEVLRGLYEVENLSLSDIAERIGTTSGNVLGALRRHGIDRRPPGGPPAPPGPEPVVLKDGYGKDGPKRRKQRTIETAMAQTRFPQLHDPAWLKSCYIDDGMLAPEIADLIGCATSSVVSVLYRWGIRKHEPRPRGNNPDGTPPRKMFTKSGYIMVWAPDHPCAKGNGCVPEHRLAVEKALGRYLTEKEVVHHVNLKRDDNRLENLLVFPDNATHVTFHANPPSWVPRCGCCGKPNPESLDGRPVGVPLLWSQ